MSQADGTGLTRDGMRQLLQRIGSMPVEEDAPDCTPFDWRQSHYFTGVQREILEQMMKPLDDSVLEYLGAICPGEPRFELREVSQHYAAELMDSFDEGEGTLFCHPFSLNEDENCGQLILSPSAARYWVSLLLGASEEGEEAETAQTLSSLEITLLGDVTGAVIRGWDAVAPTVAFQPASTGVQKGLADLWDRASHLCQVRVQLKRSEEDEQGAEGAIVVPCELFAGLAGRDDNIGSQMSPDVLRDALLNHLQDYPIDVKVELGATVLSFQDVMSLTKDDVLVLDHTVYEPINVMVAGRPGFIGMPGRSNDRQAVLITDTDTGAEVS